MQHAKQARKAIRVTQVVDMRWDQLQGIILFAFVLLLIFSSSSRE
jgi:hypothetical protein